VNRSLARTSKEIDHQSCRTSLFNPLRALLFIAGLVLVTLAQPATGSAAGDIANQPVSGSLEELAGSIEHEHPLAAFELSKRLWEAGRKDEAVFFFYLGQLRFRAHLLANRNGDPTGGRALFEALMSTMGPPINQYAFGDIPALLATIDRVIAWDDGHADDYASMKARDEVNAGLKKMRDDVIARQDEIRRTRSEKGLPNRGP
jgi:hypothetical protein